MRMSVFGWHCSHRRLSGVLRIPYEGIGRPYYVWWLVLEGFTCGAHSQALACAPVSWWRRCKGRTCLSMGCLGLVVEGVGEHLRILLVCWVWIRIYMCDCQQQQQQQQHTPSTQTMEIFRHVNFRGPRKISYF